MSAFTIRNRCPGRLLLAVVWVTSVLLFTLSGCRTAEPTETNAAVRERRSPAEQEGQHAEEAAPAENSPPAHGGVISKNDSGSSQQPRPAAPARQGDAAEQTAVDRVMAHMTLKQRIAQRFITWVPADTADKALRRMIKETPPGGFIVYPWNYDSLDQAHALLKELESLTLRATGEVRPFLCADQEGGRVNAFQFSALVRLPSAHVLGSYNDPQVIGAAAYVQAVQLRRLGINMNLGPVLDLYPWGDQTIIGDRSFGADPGKVATFARAYITAFQRAGVISVAKHFPGHGITTVDSHGRLPHVWISEARLEQTHLVPFAAAVDVGVEAVMTAHILYPALDPAEPATFSRVIVDDILRGRLGFHGVVMTDGFEMHALSDNWSVRESLKRSMKNDVDLILLISHYRVPKLVNLTERMVRQGALSVEDVDRGVRRILLLKARYGLLDPDYR